MKRNKIMNIIGICLWLIAAFLSFCFAIEMAFLESLEGQDPDSLLIKFFIYITVIQISAWRGTKLYLNIKDNEL